MGVLDILIIVSIVVLVLGVGFYFLNKWAGKRAATQHQMVEQHKQTVSIYVIDKKKDKITNSNMPKAMIDQMPKMGKMMKMPLVKAKIGPQIMTLICEKDVFEALPVKKTVTVEMAGAYIVGMKGMKTKLEMQKMRSSRRKGSKHVEAVAVESPKKWHENLLSKFKK